MISTSQGSGLEAASSSKGSVSSPTLKEGEHAISVVQTLLQHVARAFYESKHVLILEQLMRKEAMKDEELARRLGASVKDVTKMAGVLLSHNLMQRTSRSEVRPGQQKALQRTYYYLDYKHCVNVIKWRMWKLSDTLDHKQRNVMDGQGYVCPRCAKTYSTLDVGGLTIGREGFFCDVCNALLVDNDNGEEIQRNRDRMQRFNQQAAKIVKCLQNADKVKLPDFNADEWIQLNVMAELPGSGDDGLAVAKGGAKETTVSVEMAKEGDELRKRRAREEAAEAKRQANALPVWIAQSTITGALTSAGIKEGTARPEVTLSSARHVVTPDVSQDIKPKGAMVKAEEEVDDLEAYYAQEAQTAAMASGLGPHKRSPSVEYERAGSVASSRTSCKRSRDLDDEGYASVENLGSQLEQCSKKAKTNGESVQMVSVGGKLIALAAVTDDMHDEMTAEEYTAYVDLCA